MCVLLMHALYIQAVGAVGAIVCVFCCCRLVTSKLLVLLVELCLVRSQLQFTLYSLNVHKLNTHLFSRADTFALTTVTVVSVIVSSV